MTIKIYHTHKDSFKKTSIFYNCKSIAPIFELATLKGFKIDNHIVRYTYIINFEIYEA